MKPTSLTLVALLTLACTGPAPVPPPPPGANLCEAAALQCFTLRLDGRGVADFDELTISASPSGQTRLLSYGPPLPTLPLRVPVTYDPPLMDAVTLVVRARSQGVLVATGTARVALPTAADVEVVLQPEPMTDLAQADMTPPPPAPPLWPRDLQNLGIGQDMPGAMAVDHDGNVLVVGGFRGALTTSSTNTLVSSGDMDLFIAKYDPKGAPLWATRLGGSGIDYGTAIAVDASGALAIAGFVSDGAVLGREVVRGARRGFVARLSSSGDIGWARTYPAWTQAPQLPNTRFTPQVAMGNGVVYLLSHFTGVANLGGADLFGSNNFAPGVLLAAFGTTSGQHQYSRYLGQHDYGTRLQVAADWQGALWLSGDLPGGANLDLGAGKLAIAADGAFIARLNATTFTPTFSKTLVQVSSMALSTDVQGNALWGGSFRSSVDFGSGAVSGNPNGENGFLAKLSYAGVTRWAKAQSSVAVAQNRAVLANSSGDVFVTGRYRSTVDLGGAMYSNIGEPLLVARYSGVDGRFQASGFVTTTIAAGVGEGLGLGNQGSLLVLGAVRRAGNLPAEQLSVYQLDAATLR